MSERENNCSYNLLDRQMKSNYNKRMKIEYDINKRQITMEERGLDFEDTPNVFAGSRRITWQDHRRDYGEIREITMGELAGRLVIIIHTQRGDATRIISMRKANEREQRWFEKQFATG